MKSHMLNVALFYCGFPGVRLEGGANSNADGSMMSVGRVSRFSVVTGSTVQGAVLSAPRHPGMVTIAAVCLFQPHEFRLAFSDEDKTENNKEIFVPVPTGRQWPVLTAPPAY